MKPIQVGTVLYKNDDTEKIYEQFREYFTMNTENKLFVKYTITKEPSTELIEEITLYYAKVKERNKEHDEFIERVALDVFNNLSQEEKEYIFLYPDPIRHHFGLGSEIRNKYIHRQDLGFFYLYADSLSSEIISRVASMIIDHYDYENPFYGYLYNSSSFNHLRRLYYASEGEYPDAIIDQYADLPDDSAASQEAFAELKNIVINAERFQRLCTKYGITQKQYEECKKIIDAHNDKNWDLIPYDIVILKSKRLEPHIREQQLKILKTVLKESDHMAFELPFYVFNQKDAVIIAVSASGKSLKRFPRFNDDDEVIKAALRENGQAIQYVRKDLRDNPEYLKLALSDEYNTAFEMRCMKKHCDDKELVRISLKANGGTIRYASDRLKDDPETVKYAIIHQKSWYPEGVVYKISKRLRDDLEIALLDIREGLACVNAYSKRLLDCDEVAEALISIGYIDGLLQMSKRIQNKYLHSKMKEINGGVS